jgi:hypothetical protein
MRNESITALAAVSQMPFRPVRILHFGFVWRRKEKWNLKVAFNQ